MSPTRRPLLDPKVDLVFRALFGNRDHRHLLRSLLNELLALRDDRRIERLELLPRDHTIEVVDDRESIVDVAVYDQRGHVYVVEMQLAKHGWFADRMLYYGARRFGQQLVRGEPYSLVRPHILLLILDFPLFAELPHHTNRFELRAVPASLGQTADVTFSSQFAIVTVELPKLHAPADTPVGDAPVAPNEQWMRFLIQGGDMVLNAGPKEADNPYIPEIIEAYEALEALGADDSLRAAYERKLDAARTAATRWVDAYIVSREEGREEGRVDSLIRMADRHLRRRFGDDGASLLADIQALELQAPEVQAPYLQTSNIQAPGRQAVDAAQTLEAIVDCIVTGASPDEIRMAVRRASDSLRKSH